MDPPTRIRRTIRACLQCRTRKQRCDGPYTVPCQRCKSAGRECSFETEAVPESPRFHPYSGDRSFGPHALLEVQREYVQIPKNIPTFPLNDRTLLSQAHRHQTATRNRRNKVRHRANQDPKIRRRRAHLGNTVRRRKVSSPLTLHQPPTLHNHSPLIPPSSPQSWHDDNSPPSAVQEAPARAESPPRKTVNSIALAAPMATLRNLASHPEGSTTNQSSMSGTGTPEPSQELPPSVISSFDPIKRGVITVEEAHKLFTMSVNRFLSATPRLIRVLSRYFDNNYPLAPFLCTRTQRDAMHVRSTSVLLFMSICCIGARYWN